MKKVSFGAKPPANPNPSAIDDWVHHRDAKDREPMKRLTIDVPLSLHKRIKAHCAMNNLVMADEIRSLLEQRFPILEEVAEMAAVIEPERGVPS